MKIIKFIIIFFIIDLLLSQSILLNILEKKTEKAHKEDIINRVHNPIYKYTFKPNTNYVSKYLNYFYEINTNDLGFRDKTNKNIKKDKVYSIIIGDSFAEGVGLSWDKTLVGQINTISNKNWNFLNAGVSSYSSYIYLKKIENILLLNPDLRIDRVFVLLDKSDIIDDLLYINHKGDFLNSKGAYKNFRKENLRLDLINFNFWRFYTSQLISGIIIKKITDFLEFKIGNLHKRYKLSKKLNKSFFNVSKSEIQSLKSINTRKYIMETLTNEEWWDTEGTRSIIFSIENLKKLKALLNKKDIKLTIILYPWAFELEDGSFSKKYFNLILPLLKNNNFEILNVYEKFYNFKENIYETIGETFLFEDVHYNSAGYQILANSVLEYLRERR